MADTDALRPYKVGNPPSLPNSDRRYLADELQRVSQSIGLLVDASTVLFTRAQVQPDTSWQTFTYENSWVDYGTPFSPAGYRKLSSGLVILKGLVKNGISSTIATLPAGYRPGIQGLFCAQTSPNAACRIDITGAGTISHTGGSGAWISLNGITFLAEQ